MTPFDLFAKGNAVQTKRKDPITGLIYTFASFRPEPGPLFSTAATLEIRDFVIRFLWQFLDTRLKPERYPDLPKQAGEVLPLIDQLIGAIWIKMTPLAEATEAGERYDFSYTLGNALGVTAPINESIETPPSDELLTAMAHEVIESEAVFLAVHYYLNRFKKQLEAIVDQSQNSEFEKKITPHAEVEGVFDEEVAVARLFPNSKSLDLALQFGIPKALTDGFNQVIKGANVDKAKDQYENNNKDRALISKTDNSYKVKTKGGETELIIDPIKVAIQTAEQFSERLMEVRDARVLQTFCALWQWANTNDTYNFRDVPLSEIMGLILKEGEGCNFNKADRQKYTQALEFLASLTITVSTIGERVNKDSRKAGKPQLVVRTGIRLLAMESVFSVKKQFQAIPKDDLEEHHFDRTVINRFSAVLLPGNAHLFKDPANVYFRSILRLNGNQDRKAILLGFNLQTRFNQLQNKEKEVEVDRGFLIDLCDYTQTDRTKPGEATKQIKRVLDKLIEAGIISGYGKITNDNADKIKISPPKSMLAQVKL